MSAELIGTYEDGSPEWHELRKTGIGGSDIASILGLSPWKSAYTLWHEKAGTYAKQDDGNTLFEWGHRLESVIAAKFAESRPACGVYKTGTWRNVERPYQIANPDRLLGEDWGILEIKTASRADYWANGVPEHYAAQVRWYMDCLGVEKGFVAVLIAGNDYREYEIESDPFLSEVYRNRASEFVQSIADGVEPPIDGTKSTLETVRWTNPSIERNTEVELPEHIARMLLDARANLAAAETADNLAKAHALAHMGTAHYAKYDGKKIASRVAAKGGAPYLKAA